MKKVMIFLAFGFPLVTLASEAYGKETGKKTYFLNFSVEAFPTLDPSLVEVKRLHVKFRRHNLRLSNLWVKVIEPKWIVPETALSSGKHEYNGISLRSIISPKLWEAAIASKEVNEIVYEFIQDRSLRGLDFVQEIINKSEHSYQFKRIQKEKIR